MIWFHYKEAAMFKNVTVIVCLVSFFPAAVGAQELAVLNQNPQPVVQAVDRQPAREVNLSIPVARQVAAVVAQNDTEQAPAVAAERPKKTHTGLTFQEFCEVHFGEYRWIYWVGAAAILVAIHVAAAGKD
jgi:hypothetical protein